MLCDAAVSVVCQHRVGRSVLFYMLCDAAVSVVYQHRVGCSVLFYMLCETVCCVNVSACCVIQ